jgi:hypothetical protein
MPLLRLKASEGKWCRSQLLVASSWRNFSLLCVASGNITTRSLIPLDEQKERHAHFRRCSRTESFTRQGLSKAFKTGKRLAHGSDHLSVQRSGPCSRKRGSNMVAGGGGNRCQSGSGQQRRAWFHSHRACCQHGADVSGAVSPSHR